MKTSVYQKRLRRFKRDLLVEALKAEGWHAQRAAARLGMHRNTFGVYVKSLTCDGHGTVKTLRLWVEERERLKVERQLGTRRQPRVPPGRAVTGDSTTSGEGRADAGV